MALKGMDLLLYVGTGVSKKLIGGQRDVSISRSAETLDKTTKTNNGFKSSEAGLKSWSISLDGLMELADTGQEALETAYANGDLVEVEISKGSEYVLTGSACIVTFDLNGAMDDMVTYSLELEGATPLVKGTATLSATK